MILKTPSNQSVFIDRTDWPIVRGWNLTTLRKRGNTYCQLWVWDKREKRQIKQMLHRVIMNAGRGQMVCHLNGNGLDCRRRNLAFGNHQLNGSSIRRKRTNAASKYRGVHVNRGRGKRWTAMFWHAGKCVYLGRFDTQEQAALVYDAEARKRFGKFAHLNFP